MVLRCLQQETRAVCIREVQKSLKESAKKLIEDKIQFLGLGRSFETLTSETRCRNGSLITYQGMQDHTAESIKSLEGYDIAWVEEAQSLSEKSLRLLRPTIRKPGSELWFSWNPFDKSDPIDKFLRGKAKPDDAIVIQANWSDNPWFPDVLEQERQIDLKNSPETYDHVWEGDYWSIHDAQIFKNKFIIEAFDAPPDEIRPLYGVDWGFANDPTVLIRCFVRDDCLFIEYEAFGHGIEIDEYSQLFDTIPLSRKWPIKADNSRPETISYVKKQSFNITAAEKWPGSVEDGIAHMKGFRQIVIHPRCFYIAEEFRKYSYKIDKKTDEVLPVIVDKWNHGIDAVRYALDGFIRKKAPIKISDEVVRQAETETWANEAGFFVGGEY